MSPSPRSRMAILMGTGGGLVVLGAVVWFSKQTPASDEKILVHTSRILLQAFQAGDVKPVWNLFSTSVKTRTDPQTFIAREAAYSQALLKMGTVIDAFHVHTPSMVIGPGEAQVPVYLRMHSVRRSDPPRVRLFVLHFVQESGEWLLDAVSRRRG